MVRPEAILERQKRLEKSTADYEVVQTSLKEVESITVDVKEADGVGHHTIEIKATHDSTKADQIVAPEQFDSQVQNEPTKTLHQHHAATLGRLGRHADDNGAALARLDLVVQERMAALAFGHSSKLSVNSSNSRWQLWAIATKTSWPGH